MSLKKIIGFCLPLLTGMYIYLVPLIGLDFKFLPGDLDDGRFNMYLLENNHRFLNGKTDSYWDAGFMYPEKNVITYSDNLIGSTPLYMIPRLFGANRELAYQWWIVLVTLLNYVVAFFLFQFAFKNPMAAGIGAFIFAFSLALFSQTNHPQTFPRFAVPLVFYFIFRFSEHLKVKYLFLVVMLIVYQIYCGIYLGLMTFIPAFLAIILVFGYNYNIMVAKLKSIKWIAYVVSCALVGLILLLPILIPYNLRAEQSGTRTLQEVFHSIPTFYSYFFSISGTLLWDKLSSTRLDLTAWWDHTLFPGIFAVISVVAVLIMSVVNWSKLMVSNKIMAITFIASFMCFLRIGDFSVYQFLYMLPGFDSMRSITRFINIELIFVGWFGAILSQSILDLVRPKIQVIVFLGIVGFLSIDNYRDPTKIDRMEKQVISKRVNDLKNKIEPADANKVLAYVPSHIVNKNIPGNYHLDAMLAAQDLGMKTFNAYTATCPREYGPFWREPTKENLKIWTDESLSEYAATEILFLD